jgi:hypothetical protein
MERVQTYVSGQQILAAELNAIQDAAVDFDAGDVGTSPLNRLVGTARAPKSLVWSDIAGLPTGELAVVDTRNWLDAVVLAAYFNPLNGDRIPGATNDYLFDGVPTWRIGYTGKGGLGAASAAIVNGVVPVPASGTSWAMQVATDLWLYAQPSTGSLRLYNNTGSQILTPFLIVRATGATGQRP